MGEVLDRAQLLGRSGGDGFSFLGRGLGGGAGLAERLGDARRELGALPSDVGDALAGPRGLRGRFRDAVEVFYPVGRVLYHLAQVSADSLEQLRGAIERAPRVLHRLPDVARIGPPFLGQLLS